MSKDGPRTEMVKIVKNAQFQVSRRKIDILHMVGYQGTMVTVKSLTSW